MFYACSNYQDIFLTIGSGLNSDSRNEVDFVSLQKLDVIQTISTTEQLPIEGPYFESQHNSMSPVVIVVYEDDDQEHPIYAIIDESHSRIAHARLDVRYTP